MDSSSSSADSFTSFLEAGASPAPTPSLPSVRGSSRALLALSDSPELSVDALREKLGIGLVEVGTLIGALRENGLVDVHGEGADERVQLTATGREVAEGL